MRSILGYLRRGALTILVLVAWFALMRILDAFIHSDQFETRLLKGAAEVLVVGTGILVCLQIWYPRYINWKSRAQSKEGGEGP